MRDEWAWAVWDYLEDHLTAVYHDHLARAARYRLRGDISRAVWHEQRARGARKRPGKQNECGTAAVLVSCRSCDRRFATRPGCKTWKICLYCRGKRQLRKRGELAKARKHWQRKYRFLLRTGWSEKFITLTIPHRDPESDDREIGKALPRFFRLLKDYLIKHRGKSEKHFHRAPWFAVQEKTPSATEHVHWHVYAILPFIPQEVIAQCWAASMSYKYITICPFVNIQKIKDKCEKKTPRYAAQVESGIEYFATAQRCEDYRAYRRAIKDRLPVPVVDIRKVKTDEGIEDELIKYLLKDLSAKKGELIDPEFFARIIESYENRRTMRSSHKFFSAAGVTAGEPAPCQCGCTDKNAFFFESFLLLEEFLSGPNPARGPPAGRPFACTKTMPDANKYPFFDVKFEIPKT